MKGLIPFGGLQIAGGGSAVALTTSAALFNVWTALLADSTIGDQAIRPDLANNRILVSPGTYEFNLKLFGATDSAGIISTQLRKNATTVIPGTLGKASWAAASAQNNGSCSGVFQITAADIPTSGGQPTFPEPVKPASQMYNFTGAGGAPLQLVPIDLVVLIASGTANLTPSEAQLILKRLG